MNGLAVNLYARMVYRVKQKGTQLTRGIASEKLGGHKFMYSLLGVRMEKVYNGVGVSVTRHRKAADF